MIRNFEKLLTDHPDMCCEVEPKDYPPYLDYPKECKPMTNYDRLISKTPEELAEFICKTITDGVKLVFPGSFYSKADIVELNNDWLSWLKSPAAKEEKQ